MLEDYQFSPNLCYSAHQLVYTGETEQTTLSGVLAAALLSAMLADTDEGLRRGLLFDTPGHFQTWAERYEREVLRDEWGLLTVEVQLLYDAHVQLLSDIVLEDICHNTRIADLALQITVFYMRHLTVEQFGEHIWECCTWRAPFAQWLLDAANIEPVRQRYIHTDWTDPSQVTQLVLSNRQPIPTMVFEGEAADALMQRYFDWLWPTFQAQIREIPGANPNKVQFRTFLVQQESDWEFLKKDVDALTDDARELWYQWMLSWQQFIERQLKPERPVLFWDDDVDDTRRNQLTDFLRLQEKQPMHYKCLAAAVYALRQLGYIRRTCSVKTILLWLTENLSADYTLKNTAFQFRRAWNELSRYHSNVIDYVSLLDEQGITRFHP